MAHDVFISYSSKNKTVADAVCAGLESHQVRCWIAPRDVLPGENYGESIIKAMASCRVVVLVFSSATNQSPAVLREMERAMHHGLPIIPFRLEDIPMSPGLEFFLASCHWLDAMQPPLDQHIAKLTTSIQALLGREASAAPISQATKPSPTKRLPVRWLTGLLILGIGGFTAYSWPGKSKSAQAASGTKVIVEPQGPSIDLGVFESSEGRIAEHFQGAGIQGVQRLVERKPDGTLKIRDVCGYLEDWRNGKPMKPVVPGPGGYFGDQPLLLEIKLQNPGDRTLFFHQALANVEASQSMNGPLIVMDHPKPAELRLANVGGDAEELITIQAAVAGPEDALDDAKFPAPITLDLSQKRVPFLMTQIPSVGECTAYGQLVLGEGAKRSLHRFEIPMGVGGGKPPIFPVQPKTDYVIELHEHSPQPYVVECSLSQSLKPGEADLFRIAVQAPETSSHRFQLHLKYEDGSSKPLEWISPWIEAEIFVEQPTPPDR